MTVIVRFRGNMSIGEAFANIERVHANGESVTIVGKNGVHTDIKSVMDMTVFEDGNKIAKWWHDTGWSIDRR